MCIRDRDNGAQPILYEGLLFRDERDSYKACHKEQAYPPEHRSFRQDCLLLLRRYSSPSDADVYKRQILSSEKKSLII